MFNDTIAAISTPLAAGAVSIIRLSGDEAISIANKIFSRDLQKQTSHTIAHGFIQEDGTPIDEVLVSVFKAPKSYTCEDVVEINAHGGPFITRKILELTLKAGARLAKPGEFTQRAFLNGRIDLSQAEAVEQMVEASNTAQAKSAITQIRGSVSRILEPMIERLLNIIASIEVNIDYPEYDDVEVMTHENLLPEAKVLLNEVNQLLALSKRSQQLNQGIETVIVGKPNVGKSSLLNSLLDEEKAIVTDIPGTTRDIVEGQIQVGSVVLRLSDTAGIRESEDLVEQIGIRKSQSLLERAQLVLLVLDGSRPLEAEDRELLDATQNSNRIILVNKQDLKTEIEFDETLEYIPVSAANHGLSKLIDELERRFEIMDTPYEQSLGSERQIGLLENARNDIMRAIEAMEAEIEPDLIEIDLKEGHRHLKEILGEVHQDDLLEALFSNFCLGK